MKFILINVFIGCVLSQKLITLPETLSGECLKKSLNQDPNNANTGNYGKWECPIPYTIDSNLKNPERVMESMKYVEEVTGWAFVQRTNEADYMNFVDSSGCASYLGRQGGEQDVFLNEYCDNGAVIHEIGHAIGMNHEQNRSDRDAYIKINPENIPDAREHNFDKRVTINTGDYDFSSVMHYGLWGFSDNGMKTIEAVVNTDNVCFIGQRYKFSELDIQLLNDLISGLPCKILPGKKCSKTSRKLCGSSPNGLLFQEFFLMGEVNGRPYYRTRWAFVGTYFYLSYFNNVWGVSNELNTNAYYAFSRSTVMDPKDIVDWTSNYGEVSGVVANDCEVEPECPVVTPTGDPNCENGILKSSYCCHESCLDINGNPKCGGDGCSRRGFGTAFCCANAIESSGRTCDKFDAPCMVIPTPKSENEKGNKTENENKEIKKLNDTNDKYKIMFIVLFVLLFVLVISFGVPLYLLFKRSRNQRLDSQV